jgi:hypothetical protein
LRDTNLPFVVLDLSESARATPKIPATWFASADHRTNSRRLLVVTPHSRERRMRLVCRAIESITRSVQGELLNQLRFELEDLRRCGNPNKSLRGWPMFAVIYVPNFALQAVLRASRNSRHVRSR